MSNSFIPASPHRPTLLIADDDPVIRSALSMALDGHFEIVAVVCDGEEAVARAEQSRPDAALLDVDMPRGGGLHAIRGITDCSPSTAMVVLSSDEADASVRDLLHAGAMSYCRKGVDPRQLIETIERSIRAHDALRDAAA